MYDNSFSSIITLCSKHCLFINYGFMLCGTVLQRLEANGASCAGRGGPLVISLSARLYEFCTTFRFSFSALSFLLFKCSFGCLCTKVLMSLLARNIRYRGLYACFVWTIIMTLDSMAESEMVIFGMRESSSQFTYLWRNLAQGSKLSWFFVTNMVLFWDVLGLQYPI